MLGQNFGRTSLTQHPTKSSEITRQYWAKMKDFYEVKHKRTHSQQDRRHPTFHFNLINTTFPRSVKHPGGDFRPDHFIKSPSRKLQFARDFVLFQCQDFYIFIMSNREKQKEIVDGGKHARNVPRSWRYRIMSPLRFMEKKKCDKKTRKGRKEHGDKDY